MGLCSKLIVFEKINALKVSNGGKITKNQRGKLSPNQRKIIITRCITKKTLIKRGSQKEQFEAIGNLKNLNGKEDQIRRGPKTQNRNSKSKKNYAGLWESTEVKDQVEVLFREKTPENSA